MKNIIKILSVLVLPFLQNAEVQAAPDAAIGTKTESEVSEQMKKPSNLRVLMIGNSFSICVGKNLPQIVHSVPGLHLSLTSLYIGGCPLSRHWANIQETEKDPSARQYQVSHWDSDTDECRKERGSIQDQLAEKWDIITIQQASHESWNRTTYQPYLDQLIAYLKMHVPGAEIVIQQTWAYRTSDPRIAPDTMTWGFDQTGMYERLTECYRTFAKQYGLRIIPTGLAVQNTRKGIKTVYPRTESIPENAYRWPDLPSQAGDVAGAYRWTKNQAGELVLTSDSIHLNPRGEYLQACVWFATLYGKPTSEIAYVPDFIGNRDAEFLKKCAQDAVDAGL